MTDKALKGFAAQVMKVAREMPEGGRFYDNKVWIHAVYLIGKFKGSLEAFKAKVLEADRARLIELARADLLPAMDAVRVRMSHTVCELGSEYHFIVIR